jgi:hypothetical protein
MTSVAMLPGQVYKIICQNVPNVLDVSLIVARVAACRVSYIGLYTKFFERATLKQGAPALSRSSASVSLGEVCEVAVHTTIYASSK